jgi:hypothetical protein
MVVTWCGYARCDAPAGKVKLASTSALSDKLKTSGGVKHYSFTENFVLYAEGGVFVGVDAR